MNEQATVINLNEWAAQRRTTNIHISDSALRTALGHIRVQSEVALRAEETVMAESWRDEEKIMLNALGGLGLARSSRIHQ